MIKYIKEHKVTFILVMIFLLSLSVYFIRYYIASKSIYTESYLRGENYVMTPKKYGVNEYSPVYITEEQMVTIYMNDYKTHLYNDVNYAYNLLNADYRNLKFGSIENFINYVNTLNSNSMTVDKYSVNDEKNIFTIYTKDNNIYIFKINSVMEYEVYLDDYTVEI